MNKENMEIACGKIIRHYGEEHQRRKLVEECAELIQAISKHEENKNAETLAHYIEELADVEIMITQMLIVMRAKDYGRYLITINRKINRQLERIKRGDESWSE